MIPIKRTVISVVILVILVISFYYISKTISSITGKSIFEWVVDKVSENDEPGFTVEIEERNLDNFARCLNGKGTTLYIEEGCPYCLEQKRDFDSSFKYLNVIDCSQESEECSELEGVPAWEIKGLIIYGRQSIERLSRLTKCEI